METGRRATAERPEYRGRAPAALFLRSRVGCVTATGRRCAEYRIGGQPLLAALVVCMTVQSAGCGGMVERLPPSNIVSLALNQQRLELRIRPALATAPAAIRATAFVARHAGNRSLTLSVECPIYRRRSTVPLEGAAAARTHTIVFEALPACTFDISATLHRQDGDAITEVLPAKVKK